MAKDEATALSIKDLAISGKDLLEIGFVAGPAMGVLLQKLFDSVLETPSLNQREILLSMAKNI